MRVHEGLDYAYTTRPGACNDMQQRLAAFQTKKPEPKQPA